MNRERARLLITVSSVVLGVGLVACDALLGIEDFSTPGDDGGFECQVPSDCPGAGNACLTRVCSSGKCEVAAIPADQPVSSQVQGDCRVVLCNADGQTTREEVDPSDPPNDGLECTTDGCNGGDAVQMPAAPNTVCSAGVCDGQGACVECIGSGACNGTEVCIQNSCVSATCGDGIFNGDETDKDCGGGCPRCETGKLCAGNEDCKSLVCGTSNGESRCLAPTCDDNVQNGAPPNAETDVDCGGTNACPRCDHDMKCTMSDDCLSLVCACPEANPGCTQPVCQQEACDDGVENGTEVAEDCGPDCLGTCDPGEPCLDATWCSSGVCNTSTASPGTCVAPSCSDTIKNGDETQVDCGGVVCDPCT